MTSASGGFQAGGQIADYLLEARLGGGSFGDVWRARHASSGQVAAIKILAGILTDRDRAGVRAEVELLAATASSKSAHVVRVLGGGVEPVPYVVMEYIEGSDLAAVLRERGSLPSHETIRVGLAVADALCALNQAGIVHGDVKPAKVIVGRRGTVKLAAFNIVRIVGYETIDDSVTGPTMAYAAPEVWEGAATHQSDLYALGILLYQCLTGAPPFIGNYAALLRQHTGSPPNVDVLPPEIPPSLREVIRLCLEKDPGARPADAEACLDLLHRAQAELTESPLTPALSEPARFGRWLRQQPHPTQPWAWRCAHQSTGEEATVEVHFVGDLAYGALLRKAVAANPKLVPLGAERLLDTNRLLLRPGEGWHDPPPGEFSFWLARDELPPTSPPTAVSQPTLRKVVAALLALIDAAAAAAVPLSLAADRVALLADGGIHVRRPGIPPGGDSPPSEQALAFLRGLPLEEEAQRFVAAARDLRDLHSALGTTDAPAPPVQPSELGVAHPPEGTTVLTRRGDKDTTVFVPPLATAGAPPEPPAMAEAQEAAAEPAETPSPDIASAPPRRRFPLVAALVGGLAVLIGLGFLIAALWPPPTECLRAPTNLNAGDPATWVRLTWTDRSSDEDGFRIEASDHGGEYRTAGRVAANVTSYDAGPVTPGQTYRYRVRAYKGTCESEPSSDAAVTGPRTPTSTATASPTATPTPTATLTPTPSPTPPPPSPTPPPPSPTPPPTPPPPSPTPPPPSPSPSPTPPPPSPTEPPTPTPPLCDCLSFVEGDPGMPGDGVLVNCDGGQMGGAFELASPVPLAGANGIVTTVFLPPTVTNYQNTGLYLAAVHREESCNAPFSPGGAGKAIGGETLNGVEGNATYTPPTYFPDWVAYANKKNSGCNLTLDDLFIVGLYLFTGYETLPELDAAIIEVQ